MANIKIAQLTNQTAINDNDLMIVETATSTNKMTVGNFKELTGINGKVNKAQEAFKNINLLNGWVNSGGYDPLAQYYKTEDFRVHIKGQIKSGTFLDGTILFYLESGYAPYENLQFPIMVNNGTGISIGTLAIFNTGEVKIYNMTGNVAVYLNGISYRV